MFWKKVEWKFNFFKFNKNYTRKIFVTDVLPCTVWSLCT